MVGLKWATEIGANVRVNGKRIALVASVLARSATATSRPARRSAMMPDPTTVARRRAVPTASAVMRRARSVGPCGSAIAPRLVEPATQAILDLVAGAAKGRESLGLRPRHGRGV